MACVAVAAVASVATSRVPPPPCPTSEARDFAVWTMPPEQRQPQGCAGVSAWVSRSGKQGVGVTLRVLNLSEATCEIEVLGSLFEHERASVQGDTESPSLRLAPRRDGHIFLAHHFDSEALWNASENRARYLLHTAVNGVEQPLWRISMTQQRAAPHRIVDACRPVTGSHLGVQP